MQYRIKEGTDFGEFLSEWHRLLGPIAGIHKVLCCDDLTVRNWLHHGQAPSAPSRQLMRNATRDMKYLADKAWAQVKSDDIADYMHS